MVFMQTSLLAALPVLMALLLCFIVIMWRMYKHNALLPKPTHTDRFFLGARLSIDEAQQQISITQPNADSVQVAMKQHYWITPLGCWLRFEQRILPNSLASAGYVFIYKGSMSVHEYRSLCRVLYWQS